MRKFGGLHKICVAVSAYFAIVIVIFWITHGYLVSFTGKQDKYNDYLQGSGCTEVTEGWQITQQDGKAVMVSQNIDPKIYLRVIRDKVVYLDIYISELRTGQNNLTKCRGEVYFFSESDFPSGEKKVNVEFHRGHNIVKIPTQYVYHNLRIDLVSRENVTVVLDYINITNYFRPRWYSVTLLYALLCEILLGITLIKTGKLSSKLYVVSEPVRNLKKNLEDYIITNKIVAVLTAGVVLLSYGLLCAYYTIYIDEERQIIEACATQDWIAQGRFGNYIFERFFLADNLYTSFIGDACAAILLGFSTFINCHTFYRISDKSISKISQIIFCGLCVSVPYVYGAYMVVGIYNMEVSLAMCLTASSIGILFTGKEKNTFYRIWSVLLLTAAISVYQAFMPLFVTEVVICNLIKVVYTNEKIPMKEWMHSIAECIVVSIISLVLYYLMNSIFIAQTGAASGYLRESFIGWGKGESVKDILIRIIQNIRLVLLGSSDLLYGGVIYRISFFVYGICTMAIFIKKKNNRLLFLFLAVCSLVAPFCLNFIIGSTLFAGRTLLGLPCLLGIIWLIAIEKGVKKGIARTVVISLASVLMFLQIQYINQYFLADFKRYQQDQIITSQIMEDVREACNGQTKMPVVFIGTYNHDDNHLTMSYELAGSYFTVDGGSIQRMIHFIKAQGYNVDMPTQDQIDDSSRHVHDMPCWPQKGSVKSVNGYVIVKFSDS